MSNIRLNRLLLVIVGTILMGIGIELIVLADQGFDSVSTLIIGLMNVLPIPFSRWSQLLSVLFLLITFLYKRNMLGIGSIINTFLVGETISRVALLFQSWNWLQGNLYFSFLGFVIMSFGTALYLSAELGSGPLEGLMFCVCDKLTISLQKGRVALDFLIVVCGFLLGSSLGLGTFLAIFFLGPMIQGFLTFLQKINSLVLFQRQKGKRLSE